MRHTDMLKHISEATGLSVEKVKCVYIALMSTVERELLENGEAKLYGFGTFRARKRTVAARPGSLVRKESVVVSFKPAVALKERVNGTDS